MSHRIILIVIICNQFLGAFLLSPEKVERSVLKDEREIDVDAAKMLIARTIGQLKAGGQSAENVISRVRRDLERVKREDQYLSMECFQDLLLYMEMLKEPISPEGKFNWAHQMLDSFGTITSGIAQANIYWLGDFYECLDVKVMNDSSKEIRFRGRYCMAFINYVPLKIGTCFPSTCSFSELQSLAYQFVPFPMYLQFINDFSQTSEMHDWDGTNIAVGCVFGFFIFLVTFATLFDCYCELKTQRLTMPLTHEILKQPETLLFKNAANSTCTSLLFAFSARRNLKKIMDVRSSADENSIGVIHGLKAITISWVVVGHTFLVIHSFIPWKNMLIMMDFITWYKSQPVISTEFAVDTFFVISGFLACYTLLTHLSKGVKFNYPLYIIHRLFRLSPPYWLFLSFMSGLYVFCGKGPSFPAVFSDQAVCREKWWQNAFYINIYFDETTKCLPQAWYVCLDIVYYVVLYPLIVLPLHWKPLIGRINFVIIFILSMLLPACLIYSKNLASYPSMNVTPQQRTDYSTYVYDKPWGRATTVLIGMAFGYLFQQKGRHVKINLFLVYFLWACSAVIDLTLVYAMQPYQAGKKTMELKMQVFYGTFSRPAWGLTIGWIIYACATGYGGLINKILAWKGFIPVSRLSYAIYIVHFTLIGLYYGGRADGTYLDFGIVEYINISILISSFFGGLALNLLAEAPFFAMEKVVFSSCTPKVSGKNESNGSEVISRAKQKLKRGEKTSETGSNSNSESETVEYSTLLRKNAAVYRD